MGFARLHRQSENAKGINGNATSCVNYPLLLQVQGETKNPRISTQVGVISCDQQHVDSTYQYPLGSPPINLTAGLPADNRKQRASQTVNERFVLSLTDAFPVQETNTFARHGGARVLRTDVHFRKNWRVM